MARRGKVLVLPSGVRKRLDALLIECGFLGYAELTEWLEQQGETGSRSSLQRYGQSLERRIEQVRLATEQAEALVRANPDDTGAVADASQRLFELMLASEEGDLKALAAAARALAETARTFTSLRQEQRKALREAAASAGKVARRAGLTAA